jgi:hypothetical protein
MNYKANHVVGSSLANLLELGARFAGSRPEEVAHLAEMMLGKPGNGSSHSSLNNDGSPLQVSISLPAMGARPSVRLIADPAAEPGDPEERWRRAGLVLSAVLASHAPELQPLCNLVIRGVLPFDQNVRAALPGAGVWVATDLSGKGMALYATTKWGDFSQRWSRTRRWLAEVLPTLSEAHEILIRLASRSCVASIGVEGSTQANARIKVYWRLDKNAALYDLGMPIFDNVAIPEFLLDAIKDRRIPRTAIVGSVGFELASGRLSDVKLDVCAHCVRRTGMDWMQMIQRCITRHGLPELSKKSPSMLAIAELAFIGIGLDAEQIPRLNIYLKTSRLHGEDYLPEPSRLNLMDQQISHNLLAQVRR